MNRDQLVKEHKLDKMVIKNLMKENERLKRQMKIVQFEKNSVISMKNNMKKNLVIVEEQNGKLIEKYQRQEKKINDILNLVHLYFDDPIIVKIKQILL